MGVFRWTKRRFKAHPLISIAVVLLVMLGLFAGAVEYTSRPRFCLSCHYMKPFYESWAESKHRHVPCIKCHFEPGIRSKIRGKMEGLNQMLSYWTRAYRRRKPWAEISDAPCLQHGCHEERKVEGPLIYKGVAFDHADHLGHLKRGKQLRCVSCHSQIVQGEHIKVTEGTCFICHFKRSEHTPTPTACSICHRGAESPDAAMNKRFSHVDLAARGVRCESCHGDMAIGEGKVPRENCYSCHWERERLAKYSDIDLIHTTHITEHKVECQQCHIAIEHRRERATAHFTSQCSACHEGTHANERNLFAGMGGVGVEPSPSRMFEVGVRCQGCHIFHKVLEPGETVTVTQPESCEKCHGPGFNRILEQWKSATEEKIARARATLAEVKGEIDALPAAEAREKALAAYEAARANVSLVENGRPVHNVVYADKLIKTAFRQMGEALAAAGSLRKIEHAETESPSPTACVNCHYGIEEVSVTVFDEPFDHGRHVVKGRLDCSTCHSEKTVHGELVVGKADCASCHHKAESCDACHAAQRATYRGVSQLAAEPMPSEMSAAEVDCTGCHWDEENRVIRPDAPRCLDCHEAGYDAMMTQWQKEAQESLARLSERVKEAEALGPDPARDEVLKRARAILDLLTTDGSLGVHNPKFNTSLIEASIEALAEVSRDQRFEDDSGTVPLRE